MEKFISAIKSLIEVTNTLYDARHPSAFAFNSSPRIELSYNDDFTIAYLSFGFQFQITAFMLFLDTFLPGCSFKFLGNVLTVYSFGAYNEDLINVSFNSNSDIKSL